MIKLWIEVDIIVNTPYLSRERLKVMKLDTPREMKKKGTT